MLITTLTSELRYSYDAVYCQIQHTLL